jgi:hypothetical protein
VRMTVRTVCFLCEYGYQFAEEGHVANCKKGNCKKGERSISLGESFIENQF